MTPEEKLAQAERLLFQAARHLRNTAKMQPVEWNLMSICILEDVRDYDKDKYFENVIC